MPRSWRLLLVVFLVRMWRLNACERLMLPLARTLNRLAAPLLVFILGMTDSFSDAPGGYTGAGREKIHHTERGRIVELGAKVKDRMAWLKGRRKEVYEPLKTATENGAPPSEIQFFEARRPWWQRWLRRAVAPSATS